MVVLALCCFVGGGQEFNSRIHTASAGDLVLSCENPGGWSFNTDLKLKDSVEYLEISIDCPAESLPPCFSISFAVPQKDIQHLFQSNGSGRCAISPDWSANYSSNLSFGMPLYEFFNDNNRNRLTISCDELYRDVQANMGLREENCLIVGSMKFFTVPEAPMQSYSLTVRLDARDVFWAQSVREAADWMSVSAECEPCPVPVAAYNPLYSSWYQFHQNVYASDIEEELEIASALGMKTVIIDDGWQTDDNNRGYAFCGDWQVSGNRFPDMKSHVARVRDLGVKYMMWYSVPFVGFKSHNFERFKGKYLRLDYGLGAGVLDPRFPEVRQFLIDTYVQAAEEWNIDGFKLDFIDSFFFSGEDPAVAENYAGRDIKTVPAAVDALMKGVRDALFSINPEILLEFRQAYTGPAIAQYGNMFRVGDCPGQHRTNRIGICNLRLCASGVAVHSDMIEWNNDETPENVAKDIISALFGVIQYSVMLRDIPQEHLEIIKHWLDFSQEHRNALLKGDFKPYHPELGYPLVEASDDKEAITAVYQDNLLVGIGDTLKTLYVINASGKDELYLDSAFETFGACIFDMYGNPVGNTGLTKGINRIRVPESGYIRIGVRDDEGITPPVRSRIREGSACHSRSNGGGR